MKKQRTAIPKPVRRLVLIESGHKCAILRCAIDAPNLELHHIDGIPSNHDPDNLIPLCPNHHSMAERGHIDRLAINMYKSALRGSLNVALDQMAKTVDKNGFHSESGEYLAGRITPYFTTFVGPMFAHPDWCFDLTKKKLGGTGYDRALFDFLLNVPDAKASDVKIICRNSERYLEIIKGVIAPELLQDFKDQTLQRIDEIWSDDRDGWPLICCVDTGFYQLPTIHRNVAFVTHRRGRQSPIGDTIRSAEKSFLEDQKRIFQYIFEDNFRGIDVELSEMRKFITNIEFEDA